MDYISNQYGVLAELLAAQDYILGGYESAIIASGLANPRNTEYLPSNATAIRRIRTNKNYEPGSVFGNATFNSATPTLQEIKVSQVPVLSIYPDAIYDNTRQMTPTLVVQNIAGLDPESATEVIKNYIFTKAVMMTDFLDVRLFYQLYDINLVTTQSGISEAGTESDGVSLFEETGPVDLLTTNLIDRGEPGFMKFEKFWLEMKHKYGLAEMYKGDTTFFLASEVVCQTILSVAISAGVKIEVSKRFFRIADVTFISLNSRYMPSTADRTEPILMFPADAVYFGFGYNSLAEKAEYINSGSVSEDIIKNIHIPEDVPYNVKYEALPGVGTGYQTLYSPNDIIVHMKMSACVARVRPYAIKQLAMPTDNTLLNYKTP